MQTSVWSIGNVSGAAYRAAMNTLLTVLQGSNSGPTAPSPTVAGMAWFDTSNLQFKIRNNANTAWIVVGPEAIAANTIWGNPTGAPAALQPVSMAQLRTMLGYSQALVTPGYQVFPSGLIMQWGAFSLGAPASATQVVTYPVAFPAAALGSWVRVDTAAPGMIGTAGVGLTSMTVTKSAADSSARSGTYFVIGN